MSLFPVLTTITLLLSKIITKALVRALLRRDGSRVLKDSVQGLGIDIALLGVSLLAAGAMSGKVVINGPRDSFSLIAIVVFSMLSVLFYAFACQRKPVFGVWRATAVSWLTGSIPLVCGMGLIS